MIFFVSLRHENQRDGTRNKIIHNINYKTMEKEIKKLKDNVFEAKLAIEEVLFSKNRERDAKNIIKIAREITEMTRTLREMENKLNEETNN